MGQDRLGNARDVLTVNMTQTYYTDARASQIIRHEAVHAIQGWPDLRRRLRKVGVEYVVVKNTLARRALGALGDPRSLPLLVFALAHVIAAYAAFVVAFCLAWSDWLFSLFSPPILWADVGEFVLKALLQPDLMSGAVIGLWVIIVPLLFPVISTTTSIFKVRAAHFLRAGACSLAAVPAFTASMLAVFYTGAEWVDPPFTLYLFCAWLTALAAWMVFFWWRAFDLYMRLPHALWISISFNVIGFFGSLVMLVGVPNMF